MRPFDFSNPLLSRELRARFRDGRAFLLVLTLAGGLSLFFAFLYSTVAGASARGGALTGHLTGQSIFAQLSWMQTLAWLLISPALTSSSIAYERERGWFEALQLSPLSPRAIVLGKWISALLFAALLTGVMLPLLCLIFLIGGVTTRQFALVWLLHAACAMCGAAIGIATSAWSARAGTALRTAYGILLIGFIASLYGAATANELPFPSPFAGGGNALWTGLGRTNPLLRTVEITGDAPFQHVGTCLGFLLASTVFFLSIATHYARISVPEAPFIARKTVKTNAQTVAKSRPSHAEIPIFGQIDFSNPVLGREVRAKFRLRQPPLGVIIAEIVLGILVAFFYIRTFFWALFEPGYRGTIWWGLCFTGLIVSMMACAVMGANGLAREREGGTWEGVRLSMLSPREILRGKVGASLLTCALFSLPVWPLLLPCIEWSGGNGRDLITPRDVMSCLAIWGATAWSYTLIGLWMGRQSARTARASGQTLGVLAGWLLVAPFLVGTLFPEAVEAILNVSHPILVLAQVLTRDRGYATLWYCAAQGVLGLGIWRALEEFLRREMGRE